MKLIKNKRKKKALKTHNSVTCCNSKMNHNLRQKKYLVKKISRFQFNQLKKYKQYKKLISI